MFSPSANYYDIIYKTLGKDYELEANRLASLVQEYQSFPAKTLLDIACGTGEHLKYLQKDFLVEGLDLDEELLKLVHQKLPAVPLHHANMLDFDLGRKFDVVACLFSSIGYMVTIENLHRAIKNIQKHTSAGGLIVVEPWFSPEQFYSTGAYAIFVDQPDLKIARMNVNKVMDGKISVLDFQYLIATPEGINHVTESHKLGLFTHEEYLVAFAECGLKTIHDVQGLDGRGLYIGINLL